MSAVLPHYKMGPANFQVASLVYGGQFVSPHVPGTAGTTDFTVIPSTGGTTAAGDNQVLGLAGADANVLTTQTGAVNSYGQPAIDISVLTDYVAVWYGGVDIWVWYSGPANYGEPLVVGAVVGANANGSVMGISQTPKGGTGVTITPAAAVTGALIGRCTQPGGVAAASLTQQIGGQGASVYYLARARVF
jgi:hypothetical protein